MTGEATACDDRHPAFDLFKDRLQMAHTLFSVQAWRSPDGRRRDELSSLAGHIGALIDQYERRRSVGVRSIDAADDLEELRCRIAAAANCGRQQIHLTFAGHTAELSNEGALVLGLVASELVVGALERADASGSGAVTVRLEHEPSGHNLTVAEVRPCRRMPLLAGPRSYGVDFVRRLVRDLGGTLVTANSGAAVKARLPLGRSELAPLLRNISPRQSPDQLRAHVFSRKEDFHEFGHN
jgi:two-component sensor histidine kinase